MCVCGSALLIGSGLCKEDTSCLSVGVLVCLVS